MFNPKLTLLKALLFSNVKKIQLIFLIEKIKKLNTYSIEKRNKVTQFTTHTYT